VDHERSFHGVAVSIPEIRKNASFSFAPGFVLAGGASAAAGAEAGGLACILLFYPAPGDDLFKLRA